MTGLTIGSCISSNLESNPDREALIFREQRYTYRQVSEQVDRVAGALLELGIRKGDKVAVDLPNWPEFVFSYLAILRIGAVVVLVNPRYRAVEISHILNDSDSVAIILPVRFEKFHYLPMIRELRSGLARMRHVIAVGDREDSSKDILYLHELVAFERESVPDAAIEPDKDLAYLMYTSGTTGKPKGAMITHSAFVRTTWIAAEPLAITSADIFLVVVPVTHITGLFCLNTAFFYHGKAILVDVFKAEPVAEIIEREKVTVQYAVPTIYLLELEHSGEHDLTSLRTGLICGASVPVELLRRLLAMKIKVHPQYGMTETAGGLTSTSDADNLLDRTETVGRALPGIEIKLVDDAHRPVPEGQVGEVAVKGPGLMKGYYKQPQATAAAIDAEGWFYTGDLGCRDGRGFIRIVGRKKNMIIRGGYNIYPREIEDLLYTCPGVLEAVIVGVPDAVLGEKTCAWICRKPGQVLTESQVQEFCRGKIASYKVPDHVYFIESFPRTATGKVSLVDLKERSSEIIGNST